MTFAGAGPFPFPLEGTLFLFSFPVSFGRLIALTLLGRPCLDGDFVVVSATTFAFDGDRVFERVDIVADPFLRRRCEVNCPNHE